MKTIAIAFVLALGFAGAAQAMPISPLPADETITLVAQGCGPGMARNPAGKCRPKFTLKPCKPGFKRNRLGICRPIR
jgi:hypothetical protein